MIHFISFLSSMIFISLFYHFPPFPAEFVNRPFNLDGKKREFVGIYRWWVAHHLKALTLNSTFMMVPGRANLCNFLTGQLKSNMQMRWDSPKVRVCGTQRFWLNWLDFHFFPKCSPFMVTYPALVTKKDWFIEKK